MKHLIYPIVLFLLSACTALPQLYQAAEDIADDTAVKVELSKEAIQKQTDINIAVDIKNNQSSK